MLTLVDHAAPARLREAYLQLHARAPATEVLVEVRRLVQLPRGATAMLLLSPSADGEDLDWLNLNRPVVSDRGLNLVLWCEDDAAAVLARRAPDFFDWISTRVDCPPGPAAHAVVDVKRAICARAAGIAWAGDGLEDTLFAVRPGRPVRRVAVASYPSMIDALTSREPGWLVLEGIDSAFHLRRLRWAMAETGRRVIVFRRAFDQIEPGWWTVHAMHVPSAEAVHTLTAAGGTGRLTALTGLDPRACGLAVLALRNGVEAARLEELLAVAADPRAALDALARQSGWSVTEAVGSDPVWNASDMRRPSGSEAAHQERDADPVVLALREQPLTTERWEMLGLAAEVAGDFEVAIRWLTAALESLPHDRNPVVVAPLLAWRGRAYEGAGVLGSARADLEHAYAIARTTQDAPTIVGVATSLAHLLVNQGRPLQARACLDEVRDLRDALGDSVDVALSLNVLARTLEAEGDLAGARTELERALAMQRRTFANADHLSVAVTLGLLGRVLATQGDLQGARGHLERSLEIQERWLGPEHPQSVAALRALAALDGELGHTNRARDQLEHALARQVDTLGSDRHPEVADTLTALASMIAFEGDLDRARATLERALTIRREVFGDDGGLAGAQARRALADVLVAKGDLAGALEHLDRALATLRSIFEHDDHPEIAPVLRERDRLQVVQGELQRTD